MADHSYTAMTQIGDEKLDKESFAPAPKAAPEDTPHVERTYISNIMSTPNKNIIVQSPKGSGKSTGVVTAMVHRVDPELKNPQAICIVPSKESAIQNMELLLNVGKHILITSALGLPASKADYKPLAKMPLVGAQIIIGTPVTIYNWIVAKKLDIDDIKMFLIDDLDHVLAEPGFKDNVLRIMKDISMKRPQCQVIMCSTKSSDAVEAFISKTKQFRNENECIFLDNVKLYKVIVPNEASKFMVLNELLDAQTGQAIIYVHTIDIARMLCERLERNRCKSKTLDGASKEQRETILEMFQEKQFQVLISSKALDRGFDPSQIGLVVFYGLEILLGSSSEPDLEQYSHCIGRASQFDRKGAVINLMCGDMDKKIMEKIEMLKNVNEVNTDV